VALNYCSKKKAPAKLVVAHGAHTNKLPASVLLLVRPVGLEAEIRPSPPH